MLTEDPDVFSRPVVFAVHPNYIIDAAQAAASKWAKNPEKHGPNRMKILTTYVNRFKRFIDGQLSNGATIIITTMGDPIQLDNWYDEKAHWEKTDLIEMEKEQAKVHNIHTELMNYISEISTSSNVFVMPETSAGDACEQGKLDHVLDDTEEVLIIGGNLSGCLKNTVKNISKRPNGPSIKVVKELTFDDNPEFWNR